MDSKKQKLLIEFLISSPDTFTICRNIIVPDYFDPEFKNSVKFIIKYYDEYNTTPSPTQIEAETDSKFEKYKILPSEIKYCTDEIETFCKHSAMKAASIALVPLIEQKKYEEASDLIKDAVLISLQQDMGLRYFETVDERLTRMLENDPTFTTGWADVDAALFGGISRKELLLVSANSGGGKSIVLTNLAFNFLNSGKNVLYVSLELSQDIIAQRLDTMFSGIGRNNWKKNTEEISKCVKSSSEEAGILDIVQLASGTTPNEIRSYLKEFYLHNNMMPDLLILDYLDNMSPNEYVSADNVFEKDKRSAEQLRDIGVDHNMFIATASQLNRTAIGATEHNHSQIAGGISKINVADVYWSIIMTEEQKAMGKVLFIFQKTRNSDGVGKQVHLKWDAKHLRILDEDDSNALSFKKRKPIPATEQIEVDPASGDKLASLLTSFTS